MTGFAMATDVRYEVGFIVAWEGKAAQSVLERCLAVAAPPPEFALSASEKERFPFCAELVQEVTHCIQVMLRVHLADGGNSGQAAERKKAIRPNWCCKVPIRP